MTRFGESSTGLCDGIGDLLRCVAGKQSACFMQRKANATQA